MSGRLEPETSMGQSYSPLMTPTLNLHYVLTRVYYRSFREKKGNEKRIFLKLKYKNLIIKKNNIFNRNHKIMIGE
jgi:hypothetical protein